MKLSHVDKCLMALPPFPVLCRLHSDDGSRVNVKQHPFQTVPDKGKTSGSGRLSQSPAEV